MGSERRAEILDLAHLHGAVQAVVLTISQLGIEVAVGHRVVRVVQEVSRYVAGSLVE